MLKSSPRAGSTTWSAAVLLLVLGACKPKASPPTPDATVANAVSAEPAKPALPPEPPPPVAERADQVPGFEAALAKDAAYQGVWSGPRLTLNAFLTYVSELLAEGSASTEITSVVEAKRLDSAAIKLFLIFSRIGRFPANFTAKFASHRDAVKGEARHGVWSAWSKGEPIHDFTALAAWSLPEDQPEAHRRERQDALGPSGGGPPARTPKAASAEAKSVLKSALRGALGRAITNIPHESYAVDPRTRRGRIGRLVATWKPSAPRIRPLASANMAFGAPYFA